MAIMGWIVTSEHALATMKHARLLDAVWDPRQEALKQSFHPPLMVVYVKDCIVSLLPCQAHDRHTAEKQTIHPGWPTRPAHGLRSDDGMATKATWNSRERPPGPPCTRASGPSTITWHPADHHRML